MLPACLKWLFAIDFESHMIDRSHTPRILFAATLALLSACPSVANRSNASSPGVTNGLRSGDIVFQDSAPHSGQANQIKRLTNSSWSHCGIYFDRPGIGAVVVEAVGRSRKWQAWQSWKDSGAGKRVGIRRLRGGLNSQQTEKLWRSAMEYAGRPYDLRFAWGTEAMYCSELVWLAYRDAVATEIGRLGRFGDFNLDSQDARELIERDGSWGSIEEARRHADMKVISPQAVWDSERLEPVSLR